MRRFPPGMQPSLALRLALVSFLLNLATETSGVFLPLFANSIGSSNLQVGFIAATYGIAFFLSSIVFGRLSDVKGRLVFIRCGLGFSAFAYASQLVAGTPIALLAARGLIGFCLGMTSAAIMAFTYESQRQIGNFVAYGSLGWVGGALVAATVRDYEALFVTSTVVSLVTFAISLTFTEQTAARVQVARFPVRMLKENRKVYLALFIRQLGAQAIWAILPLYLAALGASKPWIALLDGINMGGQFVIMRYVERLDSATAFRAGLLMSVVVFAIYGMATNYIQFIPVQMLLAVAWSCIFVGALSYLLAKNAERGTVSGQVYSTIYLSGALGPFAGGALSQAWGFTSVMYFGSVLALLGFLSSARLKAGKAPGAGH